MMTSSLALLEMKGEKNEYSTWNNKSLVDLYSTQMCTFTLKCTYQISTALYIPEKIGALCTGEENYVCQ